MSAVSANTAATRADGIEAALTAVARPERAVEQKRYLKSDLDFLGATMGQIRAVIKEAVTGLPALDHDELVALVEALWSAPLFERRMAASIALGLHSGMLTTDDLPLVERLLRESRTWALVDGLAVDVVGSMLAADETRTTAVLDRWAPDPDFWIRRSALLAWLRPLRAGAPLERFLAYADAMLDEKEFFIRKAIGWVLREVGKRRPQEVAAWLGPRAHRSSGVTMREATKYLPRADAQRLLGAHRARKPTG